MKKYTEESTMDLGNIGFPKQKISESKKGDTWHKKHLDYAEAFSNYGLGNEDDYANMKENYNLRVNILDVDKYKNQIDPSGHGMDKFPAEFKHIGIGNAKLNLLLGDYADMDKDFRAYVSNNDSIGIDNKTKELKEKLLAKIDQLVRDRAISDEKLKEELEKLQEWSKYSFQSVGEKVANAILRKEFWENNYEFMFQRTFEDLLTSGRQIALVDIVGKKPIMERIHPMLVKSIGTTDSMYLHDQDIIVISEYMSVGKIHDRFWDKLKDNEVSKLESNHLSSGHTGNPHDLEGGNIIFMENPEISNVNPLKFLSNEQYDRFSHNNAYRNSEGEWRVLTMFWKSRRKIGERTSIDPETGVEITDYVNEHYVADEAMGEKVEWKWISEWRKAQRIGKDIDLYHGPVEHATKSLTNISYGIPPIIGVTASTNSYKVQSLMDIIKPFDLAYDIGFWKRELQVATYKGKATAINPSMIPAEWDPAKFLHFAEVDKIIFLDPTQEILKGPNQGKSAGMFNTFFTQEVSLGSDAESIQMLSSYLQSIEYTMGKISGIHGAREGEIGQRTAVRNAQAELEQFSKITEKWFIIDNEFRKLVIKKFLEVCKIAYYNTPERGMYLLNEVGQEYIQVTKDFTFAEYDIHIPSSKVSKKLFAELRDLGQAAMQNGQITMEHMAKMILTDSASERIQILKDGAKQIQKSQQEQQQAALQSAEKMQEVQYQMHKEDNETKIEVALINAEAKDRDSERKSMLNEPEEETSDREDYTKEKILQSDRQHSDKLRLEQDKLSEQKRKNLADEQIKRMQKKSPKS
jgi:hypothetical protein